LNLEKLGTFIHNKREEAGIPLAKAAQKAGIGRSTLWILEHGNNPKTGKPSRPSKDILERLAQVFHMSQDELDEAFALADYQACTQPAQASSHVPPTLQTGATLQGFPSQASTITEINGTVYLASDGYLHAFDAKTGKRLWSSSTDVSAQEQNYGMASGDDVELSALENFLRQMQEEFTADIISQMRTIFRKELARHEAKRNTEPAHVQSEVQRISRSLAASTKDTKELVKI